MENHPIIGGVESIRTPRPTQDEINQRLEAHNRGRIELAARREAAAQALIAATVEVVIPEAEVA